MILTVKDVLQKKAGVQILALPDGRLMVRHGKGITLRAPLPLKDVERVLAEVDGVRSIEELCRTLPFLEVDVLALLQALLGEVVVRKQDRKEVPSPHWLAWGKGVGAFIENCPTLPAPVMITELTEPVDQVRLLLCVPQGESLAELFAMQQKALELGLPMVALTGEAGQLVLGPPALPGRTACLACTRLAPFGEARATIWDTVGEIKSDLKVSRRAPAFAYRELGRLLEDLLAGRPCSYTEVLLFEEEGRLRKRNQTRLPDCRLCRDFVGRPPRASWADLAAGAMEDTRQKLGAFTQGCQWISRESTVRHLGIVGGGTAGFLAALALRKKLPDVKVSLLHSSSIPVIGVGEATTPLMAQFLHGDLGLAPGDLFREVAPTFKLGIRFQWGGPAFNYPFGGLRLLEALTYDQDLAYVSLQSKMMDEGKLPLFQDDVRHAWLNVPTFAYHLDNRRFAAWLEGKSREAGVEIIDCRIDQVCRDGEEITALVDDHGVRRSYDFYLDCSGFRSLLLGDALGSTYRDFSSSLLTDRALVGAIPAEGNPRPYTTATALEAGWCWEIPLSGERHVGYVFASAFSSDARAEEVLRARFPHLGETRVVPFRSGRRSHFLKGNVAALGNAYGFVEPLESTSLHLLIRQIELLVRAFPFRGSGLQDILNRQVNAWWDYLCWFLAIHYKYNHAMDTPFWRACRAEVDVSSYDELVRCYGENGPLSAQSAANTCFSYPDPLWGAEGIDLLLAGQGVPSRRPVPGTSSQAWRRWCDEAAALVGQMPGHGRVLRALNQDPSLAEGLGRMIGKVGNAFSTTWI